MRFDALPRINALQVGVPDLEEWILARDPTAIGSWRSWGADEYARAFTAAQTAGADVVDDLYFGLVDTISKQGTEVDFQRAVLPILKAKGWLGGDERLLRNRVALIYDTNLRLGRAAGRWTRYQASKSALPYVRGITVGDERVRHPPKSKLSDHRAFAGIILPLDHPFVAEYWTPLGFRCRCQWVQMSRSQLARYKGGITSEEELAKRRERIGPPVFRSPAAPFDMQLADMVRATNEEPMPGRPAVDPVVTRQRGNDLWAMMLADDALRALDDFLTGLFGKAA